MAARESLLVAESAGNQAYIYRSNRLREAVGASHLIAQAGTGWIDEALRTSGVGDVTRVVSTSGKAVLLGERSDLTAVARAITLKALIDGPGLDLAVGIVDIQPDESFFAALRRAFRRLASNRASRPGPDARFQRLPILAACASSGGVAQVVERVRGDATALSLEASSKRSAAQAGLDHIRSILRASDVSSTERAGADILANSVDDLDDDTPGQWIAVVHADGNGLGQLFLSFDEHLRVAGRTDLIGDVQAAATAYSSLSTAVERCTAAAFTAAVSAVADIAAARGDRRSRVVPVLVGGDDITAVASGSLGLEFARAYVEAFTAATATDPTLGGLGVKGLTASASVVFTKPHFPYWSSYEMATDLLGAAKETVRRETAEGDVPEGVIDLHMVYDSSASDIASARAARSAPNGGERLWGGPYAVADASAFPTLGSLRDLAGQVSKGSAVSAAAVHDLRSRLTTIGMAAATRRQVEVAALQSLGDLAVETPTGTAVLLLDAMDLNDVEGTVWS